MSIMKKIRLMIVTATTIVNSLSLVFTGFWKPFSRQKHHMHLCYMNGFKSFVLEKGVLLNRFL